MNVMLIILGLFVGGLLLAWVYARMGNARDVDEEEEAQVRAENSEAHERARFEEKMHDAAQRAKDADFYANDSGD
jgi:hypothetical protein